ncbi:MAG: acyltransferase family protein [Actinobacteria bacterium]|nr:acyltransferase family protein [Actinomycetota bacterium]
MSAVSGVGVSAGATGTPHLAFRPDVEGLRAIAILLVVGYHAGLPFIPGGFIGVDVFFVISGFLITGLLVAEAHRSGHVALASFWARRARRLLPAAVLVLVVVALVSWFVIPAIDHELVGGDIVAASLYVSNIRFAAQATDYLGAGRAESPVLHFWSLGVEEQFYLVWPLLVLAVAAYLVKRAARGERLFRTLAIVLAVIGVLSFIASLRLTTTAEPWAFFGTPTRAWEFAVGGLIAIGAASGFALGRQVRAVVGIVGVVVLLAAAVRINADMPYPGTAAIWPVLGTGLLLVAGTRRPDDAPVATDTMLGAWPMRSIGRLSYSWYLWHWPVLVLVAAWLGPQSVLARTALVILALIPAALAFRFIEKPIHHAPSLMASPRKSLVLGGVLSLFGVVAGLMLWSLQGGGAFASTAVVATASESDTVRTPTSTASASPVPQPSKAVALAPPKTGSAITPAPSKARADLPSIYGDDCHLPITATAGGACVFGDTTSKTTIALIGDSHAAQWFPALDAAGKRNHWKIVARTKSGCAAPDVTFYLRSQERPYTECDEFRAAMHADLTGPNKPDLVLATSTQTESLVDRASGERLSGAAAQQEWKDGWKRTLATFSKAGVPVVVLRDTPWPGTDMAKCVSQHLDDPSACDLSTSTLSPTSFDIDLVTGFAGVTAIDLTDALCSGTTCPAVIGKYLVYRDDSHLTATYATALATRLAEALKPLLG